MKVRFTPSIENYVYATQKVQERYSVTSSFWTTLFYYYMAMNVIAVPGILVYFGYYIGAGVALAITLAFSLLLKTAGETNHYESYYRQVFGENPEPLEVELSDEGVRTGCEDCFSVYKWRSITEVENSEKAIYLFTKDCGIPVPKSAFSSSNEISDFLLYADSKIGETG